MCKTNLAQRNNILPTNCLNVQQYVLLTNASTLWPGCRKPYYNTFNDTGMKRLMKTLINAVCALAPRNCDRKRSLKQARNSRYLHKPGTRVLILNSRLGGL